jgi:solute carrier family 25 (mitochondrial phosphate transporter), member 23/24/25/41
MWLQVSGWDGAKRLHADHGHAIRYSGMVDCFVRTVKEEGVGALFKGIVPNYVKVIPSIAIAFVVYEHVCEQLHVEVKISAS